MNYDIKKWWEHLKTHMVSREGETTALDRVRTAAQYHQRQQQTAVVDHGFRFENRWAYLRNHIVQLEGEAAILTLPIASRAATRSPSRCNSSNKQQQAAVVDNGFRFSKSLGSPQRPYRPARRRGCDIDPASSLVAGQGARIQAPRQLRLPHEQKTETGILLRLVADPDARSGVPCKHDHRTSTELANYEVYINDDGLIYDASLNQTSASNSNNKFYRLQLRRTPEFYYLIRGTGTGIISNDFKASSSRWGHSGPVLCSACRLSGFQQTRRLTFFRKSYRTSQPPYTTHTHTTIVDLVRDLRSIYSDRIITLNRLLQTRQPDGVAIEVPAGAAQRSPDRPEEDMTSYVSVRQPAVNVLLAMMRYLLAVGLDVTDVHWGSELVGFAFHDFGVDPVLDRKVKGALVMHLFPAATDAPRLRAVDIDAMLVNGQVERIVFASPAFHPFPREPEPGRQNVSPVASPSNVFWDGSRDLGDVASAAYGLSVADRQQGRLAVAFPYMIRVRYEPPCRRMDHVSFRQLQRIAVQASREVGPRADASDASSEPIRQLYVISAIIHRHSHLPGIRFPWSVTDPACKFFLVYTRLDRDVPLVNTLETDMDAEDGAALVGSGASTRPESRDEILPNGLGSFGRTSQSLGNSSTGNRNPRTDVYAL
ncbi:hypothetical protein DL770_008413 [Monosporascus sp. CRB-9-2]|nr:hypothetical protein DL770_008413 [Monosporascus sp. CRB-9-2]